MGDGGWPLVRDRRPRSAAAAGSLLALATRRFRRELKPRDGFLLVTLGWLLMSAVGGAFRCC